jgi:hypothetical protein
MNILKHIIKGAFIHLRLRLFVKTKQQHGYASYRVLKILLWGCFALFSAATVCAQDGNTVNNLQQQFNNYQQQAAQEKIYVHIDKDFFTAGEILWFKAYAVNAATLTPTTISKVAYIEVLDAAKKPVLQAKIKLTAGSGNGSFQLPVSMRSGNYQVRAYTNWMKNFSADLYYTQGITIINTLKNLDRQPNVDSARYDLQFFPEGGNLVAGIKSRVALRITNQFGKGVDCSGSILDAAGNTVTNFKTLRFGIGSFSFTPLAGAYTAIVTVGGKTIKQTLPAVASQGYVIQVEEAGNNTINATVFSANQTGAVYLLVTNGSGIKTATGRQLQDGKAVFNLNKATLGDGITHFTVFDGQAHPVCERLYFKKPASYLRINAKAAQEEYAERTKTTIEIEAAGEAGAPQSADMSMSVYRIDSLQPWYNQGITGSLLLSTDLRGTIEEPGYYFTANDAETNEALDNLMLTHGWSRYNWKDIEQNNKPVFEYLPEYEGHIVTARITDKKTAQPAPNILAYLSSPGKNFKFAIARSNDAGIAHFNVPDFIGGDAVILQTNQMEDSNYRIDIINPFSEKYTAASPAPLSVSENLQGLLVQHSINTQVQNAYYSEKNKQFFASVADTLPFFGRPSNSYLLDDYTRFTTMEEVLREYIPEIAVRKHRDNFVLKVIDDGHLLYFDDNPLVLVDGVPFFNMDTVISFNPLKIKKLDVVTRKYYLGSNAYNGIVSYSTYKNDMEGIPLDPASLVLEYEGMQLQREFYAPVYDTPNDVNARLPDFRELLAWKPDLKTDAATGKTQATFYTSDLPGKYAVVIQGLTPDGKPGSKTFFIQVK